MGQQAARRCHHASVTQDEEGCDACVCWQDKNFEAYDEDGNVLVMEHGALPGSDFLLQDDKFEAGRTPCAPLCVAFAKTRHRPDDRLLPGPMPSPEASLGILERVVAQQRELDTFLKFMKEGMEVQYVIRSGSMVSALFRMVQDPLRMVIETSEETVCLQGDTVQRIRLGFEIPGVAERCAETLVVHTAEADLPAARILFSSRADMDSFLRGIRHLRIGALEVDEEVERRFSRPVTPRAESP